MCPPAENTQREKPLNNIILITSLFINLSFLTLQAGLPTGTFKPWQIVQNVAAHQLQQSSHYPPFTACPIITERQEISLRTRLLCRLSELERVNCEYATSSVLTDWCGVPVYSLWGRPDEMRWERKWTFYWESFHIRKEKRQHDFNDNQSQQDVALLLVHKLFTGEPWD